METTLLAAEDFRPGYRYWKVLPYARNNWTIRSVEIVSADYSVWRDNVAHTPTLVIHTYRDGRQCTFELGEMIATLGPWHTDSENVT